MNKGGRPLKLTSGDANGIARLRFTILSVGRGSAHGAYSKGLV